MSNTSATGGALLSPSTDRKALRAFFQAFVHVMTGLPPTMVRPRWQRNPPPAPDYEVNWCGMGLSQSALTDNTYSVQQDDNGSTLRYDERITMLCSFYGPECEDYAETLRDSLRIGQNRDLLREIGAVFHTSGSILHVPELINEQWHDRADIEINFDREVKKSYKILSLQGAIGRIITETFSLPIEVEA